MKWIYTAIDIPYDNPLDLKETLNGFGKNGWELVGQSPLNSTIFQNIILYTFKKSLK